MASQSVFGLRADIVPHRDWAVSRWFYTDPIWYYHRRSAAHEICTTGKFYQLVDPELREVCQLLNHAGIRTTPSCQGHSHPRQRFEEIWKVLKRDEHGIRDAGVVVKDCENDQPYLFRDIHYVLPWPSVDAFYNEAAAHQNVGYLGVIIPPHLEALASRLEAGHSLTSKCRISRDEELGHVLGGILLSVRVNARDAQERTRIWRRTTDEIREVLEAYPALRSRPLAESDSVHSLNRAT
jgi:hypothetical protein